MLSLEDFDYTGIGRNEVDVSKLLDDQENVLMLIISINLERPPIFGWIYADGAQVSLASPAPSVLSLSSPPSAPPGKTVMT